MPSGSQKKYPHVTKKRNKWYYYIYESGKLKWSRGYDTRELAYSAYEHAAKYKADKDTVADIINKYQDLWRNKQLSENSLISDRTCIRNYINPLLGKVKVSELKKIDILKFQNDVLEKAGDGTQGSGIVMTNHVLGALKKIFNKALEFDLISKNPAKGIKRLKTSKRDYPILKASQLFDVINNLNGKNKYIVAVAGLAGARIGEVFGFQWKDVDFENEKLTFERQVSIHKLKKRLKSPTSETSIDMLPNLVDLLKEWKTESREGAVWLFENTLQSFMDPTSWSDRQWQRKIRPKFDFLNGFRFHDLKHTYASLLISTGLQPKEVQQLCRHATLSMTMDRYGHLFPDDVKKKVNKIRFDK